MTTQGRWLTRDPLGYAGGPNLYGYCGNNPTNAIDPLGLDWNVGGFDFTWSGTVEGVETGAAAVGADASFGLWNGGSFRCEPGFGGSQILGGIGLAAAGGAAGAGLEAIGAAGDMAEAADATEEAGDAIDGAEQTAQDCGNPNGCFVAGTPVQMADGTTKPIQDVKAGDMVKSRNPETGKTEAKKVLTVMTLHDMHLIDLHLSNGETITCTPVHPIYVQGMGFVPAGQLAVGNAIVTRAGPAAAIDKIVWQPAAEKVGLAGGYTSIPSSTGVQFLPCSILQRCPALPIFTNWRPI